MRGYLSAHHSSAWFMRFEPDKVEINLRPYPAPAGSSQDKVITIDTSGLVQIRRATKPARGEESADQHFVELWVSENFWCQAQQRIKRHERVETPQDHHSPLGIQVFERSVLQVATTHARRPKDLVPFWVAAGYPVIDPYTVSGPIPWEALKDAPKELI